MYNDYLAHYGVKGMKWGVRKTPKRSARSRSKVDNSLKKAQISGKKALTSYQRISDEYDAKFDKALERNDQAALSKLEKEYDERIYKEVYEPLYKAGYDYVSQGYGTSGSKSILSLQYGKYLDKPKYDRYGMELWVDEYMINNGTMKAYRNTYDD